jgi:competence protein ComEC
LIISSLCILSFFAGGLHYTSTILQVDESILCFYNDIEDVQFQGIVKEEPDNRDKFSFLKISAREVRVADTNKEVSGTVLIRVNRYPSYHYGDILKITGKLETPSSSSDFDYQNYLAKQSIYSVVYYPEIDVLARKQGLKPLQWIYSLRERFSVSLTQALPEPQASLAQGILLGIRGNISQSLYHQFSITGTAHLLAISGMHISIVIIMILSFSILLFGRQHSIYFWIAILAAWCYVLLTGMRPPVIRAAIMASLFLTAELLGRQRSTITALAFAAAVMIAIQPQLLWTTSFQLSFMAMCGLIFLYPIINISGRQGISAIFSEKSKLISISNVISDTFAATLAVTIAIWPIIAQNFQIISLVALPANLFALPALPAIIISSALVAFAGLLMPFVAQILGWIAWLFLSYLLLVVQSFAASRFCYIEANNVTALQICIYYIGAFISVILLNHRKQLRNFFSRQPSGDKE